MSFPERAESLRAKAHLSGMRLPVLVGITAVVVVVLALAGMSALTVVSGGFSVERTEGAAVEGTTEHEPAVSASVFVHVGGAVVAPGVQELTEGSRVQDAIAAAGGFAEGAAQDALNLARVVMDGEQVVVPTAQELENQTQDSGGVAGAGGGASPGGKVNINRATAAELDALPGIGPATAEKIVADREANGPFATAEDIKRVSGIGDKKYAELADQISVG